MKWKKKQNKKKHIAFIKKKKTQHQTLENREILNILGLRNAYSILTASRGLTDKSDVFRAPEKKKIFQLWNTVRLMCVVQWSLDVMLSAVSNGRAQFSVAGRKALGHSSLELYRSLARAEQCASTQRERARGRGEVWSPRPALSNIEPPWLPCVLLMRSNASGNIGTLLRVCHLSQLKTFIQDGHERNNDSQFVSF